MKGRSLMMLIVRVMFHPWRYGPRRDRLNGWIYDHAPKGYRRAVIRLGMQRHPENWPPS